MNKKGVEVALPWEKIIQYLLIILVFVVIIILLVIWRRSGAGLIDYLLGMFK